MADARLATLSSERAKGGCVNPRNAHQDATVVCPNHASSTVFHELVGKAHKEENEAGRNVFLRPPSAGAFTAW